MKGPLSLRDALLWTEGSLDAWVALAIAEARQLIFDHGGSPEEVETFLDQYRAQLAQWKAEQLREVERGLRDWDSAPPEASEPRPPGASLH
jgi:hypothetical protein